MIGHYLTRPRTEVNVDFICVGAGPGMVAAAISLAERGFRVLLAHHTGAVGGPGPSGPAGWPEALCARWGVQVSHRRTLDYIGDLFGDLGDPRRLGDGSGGQIISSDLLAATRPVGAVPPFVGRHLRTWAVDCVRSQEGTVSTEVSLPGATEGVLSGGAVELHHIGELSAAALTDGKLWDWLLNRAITSGVTVRLATPWRRLVFEDNEVAGVVIGSEVDERIIRARCGVVFGVGEPPGQVQIPTAIEPTALVRVCLVSKAASRFGRLALLAERDVNQVRFPRRPAGARGIAHRNNAPIS